jgi:hypothetical protein
MGERDPLYPLAETLGRFIRFGQLTGQLTVPAVTHIIRINETSFIVQNRRLF